MTKVQAVGCSRPRQPNWPYEAADSTAASSHEDQASSRVAWPVVCLRVLPLGKDAGTGQANWDWDP